MLQMREKFSAVLQILKNYKGFLIWKFHLHFLKQQLRLLKTMHIGNIRKIDPLVMVIHRNRKGNLCVFLAYDIAIHLGLDLSGGGKMIRLRQSAIIVIKHVVPQKLAAGFNTFRTNIDTGTGDQPGLILPLAAERTENGLFVFFRHETIQPFPINAAPIPGLPDQSSLLPRQS